MGPTVEEAARPKPEQLKSTVELRGQLGQPSFFVCLDFVSKRGETSRGRLLKDGKALVSAVVSPHVDCETDDQWSPLSSTVIVGGIRVSIGYPR